METFALLVAGTRTYNNYNEFCKIMDNSLSKVKLTYNIQIVHGGANGADTLAGIYAKNHGYDCKVFMADWNNYGKSAGYRRNSEMHSYIEQFEYRGCICFWDGKSKGTQHNFKLAHNANTPLKIYDYNCGKFIRRLI